MNVAGAQGGLTLRELDRGGTTIYVLDLGEAGSLFGLPTENPVDGVAMTPQLAFAQRDDLVVIGVTEGFVEAVLDVTDGNALADSERYQHAFERAGASNRGQAFVDLATILEAYGQAGLNRLLRAYAKGLDTDAALKSALAAKASNACIALSWAALKPSGSLQISALA